MKRINYDAICHEVRHTLAVLARLRKCCEEHQRHDHLAIIISLERRWNERLREWKGKEGIQKR